LNKKKIIFFTIICTIFFIPSLDSHAISFPVKDSVDDVEIFSTSVTTGPGTPTYYPPVDIYSISHNNSYLQYNFVGQPIIDNKHKYSVLIEWDNSTVGNTYYNFTMLIAGNLTVSGVDENNDTAIFYNGTYSMISNSSNYPIWAEINNNTFTLEGCDSMSFAANFSYLTSWFGTDPFRVSAWARVPQNFAVYPLPDIGPGNNLEKTNGGWVCDSAGSGFCWIPWPDEGAIELPIIITIIGTSFAVIIVIRRRKSGGKHI